MKEFADLGEFATHLNSIKAGIQRQLQAGLEQMGVTVRDAAREELEQYYQELEQSGQGAELELGAMTERGTQGAAQDDPGLRSDVMQASIACQVSEREVVVGSADEKLVGIELGTEKTVPWPVLLPAFEKNWETVVQQLSQSVLRGLLADS